MGITSLAGSIGVSTAGALAVPFHSFLCSLPPPWSCDRTDPAGALQSFDLHVSLWRVHLIYLFGFYSEIETKRLIHGKTTVSRRYLKSEPAGSRGRRDGGARWPQQGLNHLDEIIRSSGSNKIANIWKNERKMVRTRLRSFIMVLIELTSPSINWPLS